MEESVSLKFRQVKVRLKNNSFLVLRNRFKTREDVMRYLEKKKMLDKVADIYVSVSQFLNPTTTGPKKLNRAGYKWADNCFLRSDMVVEIDSSNKNNLLGIYMCIKRMGYEKFFFVRTSRGIHIWILDFWDKFEEKNKEILKKLTPRQKENLFLEEKVEFLKKIVNKGYNVDFNTSIDTRRVVRLWNTYHRNGFFCKSYSGIQEVMATLPNDDEQAYVMRGS